MGKVRILSDSGEMVEAVAPVIVSASRATDIPAFYADWFFERLHIGHVVWRNPYSGRPQHVSFQNTKFIVFWSKNPAPLLRHIPYLKERGIGCYVQYTLNDYQDAGLEPNVPSLEQRVDTFRDLVRMLGPGSVVWRFDPLVLTREIGVDALLAKVSNIADKLAGYAEKLVFSYADIVGYKKVERSMSRLNVPYIEWTDGAMLEFAGALSEINAGKWRLRLATCAESIDLSRFGIEHNRCIDPELISRLAQQGNGLEEYLAGLKKDKGQRPLCGCAPSKDIGCYNTCPHGCAYCYANTSQAAALANYQAHMRSPMRESIL